MRLYNQTSCTPEGTTRTVPKQTGWSPTKAWIPKRQPPDRRSLLSLRRTVSFQDHRDDQHAPLISADSQEDRTSSFSRDDRMVQLVRASPKTLTEWPFESKTPIRRQASWSPRTKTSSAVPFLRTSPRSQHLNPAFKLRPRTKEERVSSVTELSSKMPSVNLKDEADDPFAVPKLNSTEESSDDSSSMWMDFSLDGSENPFHEDDHATKACFEPIRKAKRQHMSVMVVKPTPVRKKKSTPPNHYETPSHHSIAPQFSSYGSSAFVVRRQSPGRSFQSIRYAVPSTPSWKESGFDSPSRGFLPSKVSPRHMSPRRTMSVSSSAAAKPYHHSSTDTMSISEHLSTYSCMLRSGVAFEHVERMMRNDRYVDPSVMELLRLAYKIGRP